MRKKEITLPTVLGLLLTIGGLVSGIWLLRGQVGQSAQAEAGEEPKEVRIANVSDTQFSISWITDTAVSGFIQYAEGRGPEQVISDERDQESGSIGSFFTHFVTVKGLKAETNYAFKIGSGKNIYDSNGQAYPVKTGPVLANPPAADVAYGSIVTANKEPADGALVFLVMPGIAPQAALVKPTGSWVIPISTARSTDLASFAQYDKQTTQVQLTVQDGPMGSATATLPTKNDNPVAEIVLGQNYDLSSQQEAATGSGIIKSKFTAESLLPASESGVLVILTPSNGEKVNSNKPVIIGQAPAGTEVTVEVHSNTAIVNKIQVGSDGKFTYSVPQNLTPGQHTVTISALVNGVMQSITRSFTVYAAGESTIPFYSATPSATLAPAPTTKPVPSATPTPTAKPTPTLRLTPTPPAATATPGLIAAIIPTTKPVPTAVPVRLPTPTPTTSLVKSGNDAPTIGLLILGIGMTLAGGWWYRKAK